MCCRLHILMLMLITAAACAHVPAQTSAAALRAQLDEDWKYWMTEHPEVATYVGYPGQNARWPDYTQPAIDARAAYLKKSVDRLAARARATVGRRSDQLRPL